MSDEISLKRVQVAVCGAGSTGLLTTLFLADVGIKSALFDPNEELCGRAQTRTLNNLTLNMGPNWLHGGYANPLYKEVKERYTRSDKKHYDVRGMFSNPDEHFVMDDNGVVITVTEDGVFYGTAAGDALTDRIYTKVEAALKNGGDRSVAEVVHGERDLEDYIEYGATAWMGHASARDYSAYEYYNDKTPSGGLIPNAGFEGFFDPVVREIHQLKIPVFRTHINSIVRGAGAYLVGTSNGQPFTADCVLLTASLYAVQNIRMTPSLTSSPQIASCFNDIVPTYLAKKFAIFKPNFLANVGIEPNTHIRVWNMTPKTYVLARPAGKDVAIVFLGGRLGRESELWSEWRSEEFVNHVLDKIPMFNGHREARRGKIIGSSSNNKKEFGYSYTGLRVGGRRPDGPLQLNDEGIFLANSDTVPVERSAGTLGATAIAARDVVPKVQAYLRSLDAG